MRNRQLLVRIDRHLDRADERWASIDEEIRLTREEVRLSREQRDRHAEMFDRHAEMFDRHAEMADRHAEMADRHAEIFGDVRVFTRDLMVRMERLTRDHAKAMRDLHEESVAHRQALLRLLDRLGPGDSPSPA